jgi:hypothetical protein
MAPTVSALAAVTAALWLLRHDGAWDTYRTPLFWPFLFAAGVMMVFSTTDAAADPRGWRALVARVAGAGAAIAGLSAVIASRNPIFDLHARDVVALAVLAAVLIGAAGVASALAERCRARAWIRCAWCAAATMLVLALIPRVLLVLH